MDESHAQSILVYNKVMCECNDSELSTKELKLDTLEWLDQDLYGI
jgi:hypothetical protein